MSESQESPQMSPEAQAASQEVKNMLPKPKRMVSEETRAKMRENAKNSDWAKHLAQFRKDHPEIKGRAVMTEAAKTYTKKAKPAAPAPEQ